MIEELLAETERQRGEKARQESENRALRQQPEEREQRHLREIARLGEAEVARQTAAANMREKMKLREQVERQQA